MYIRTNRDTRKRSHQQPCRDMSRNLSLKNGKKRMESPNVGQDQPGVCVQCLEWCPRLLVCFQIPPYSSSFLNTHPLSLSLLRRMEECKKETVFRIGRGIHAGRCPGRCGSFLEGGWSSRCSVLLGGGEFFFSRNCIWCLMLLL